MCPEGEMCAQVRCVPEVVMCAQKVRCVPEVEMCAQKVRCVP